MYIFLFIPQYSNRVYFRFCDPGKTPPTACVRAEEGQPNAEIFFYRRCKYVRIKSRERFYFGYYLFWKWINKMSKIKRFDSCYLLPRSRNKSNKHARSKLFIWKGPRATNKGGRCVLFIPFGAIIRPPRARDLRAGGIPRIRRMAPGGSMPLYIRPSSKYIKRWLFWITPSGFK